MLELDKAIIAIISIISTLFLLFYITEDIHIDYISAIRKTWKNRPIYDITTNETNGYEKYIFFDNEVNEITCDCSFINDYSKIFSGKCKSIHLNKGCVQNNQNKASFFNHKELYVKYYDADYLTLFSRIDDDNPSVCKDGFKRCGYLDILKNIFCVKESEKCPVNSFIIENDTFIFNNTGNDLMILNQLYVSENKLATLFDINRLYTFDEMTEFNKYYDLSYNYTYQLFHLFDSGYKILKSTFFDENNLIKGDIPNYYNNTYMYLLSLGYPGHLKNFTLNSFYIGIFYFRFTILFPLLFMKILLCVSLCITDRDKINLIWDIIIIISLISIFVLDVFSILFFIIQYKVKNIIHHFGSLKYYPMESIGGSILFFGIFLNVIPDLVIFITSYSFLKSKSKEETD